MGKPVVECVPTVQRKCLWLAHDKWKEFREELVSEKGRQLSTSHLLFSIVMDVVTKEARNGLPWELMYADDPNGNYRN